MSEGGGFTGGGLFGTGQENGGFFGGLFGGGRTGPEQSVFDRFSRSLGLGGVNFGNVAQVSQLFDNFRALEQARQTREQSQRARREGAFLGDIGSSITSQFGGAGAPRGATQPLPPRGPQQGQPPGGGGTPTGGVGGVAGDPRILAIQAIIALIVRLIQGRQRQRRGGGGGAPPFVINQFPPAIGVPPTVPNIPTLIGGGGFPGGGPIGFPGGGGFGGFPGLPDFGGLIGALPGIIDIIRGGRNGGGSAPGPIALPGGAPIGGLLPTPDLPFIDIVPQGATCITPRQSTSMRLPARVDVPTMDASGNMRVTTYKNMGRPVLYTGDFAAAKRVKKVAGRARRAAGGR